MRTLYVADIIMMECQRYIVISDNIEFKPYADNGCKELPCIPISLDMTREEIISFIRNTLLYDEYSYPHIRILSDSDMICKFTTPVRIDYNLQGYKLEYISHDGLTVYFRLYKGNSNDPICVIESMGDPIIPLVNLMRDGMIDNTCIVSIEWYDNGRSVHVFRNYTLKEQFHYLHRHNTSKEKRIY